MNRPPRSPLQRLQGSGFPLQLALEQVITKDPLLRDKGWSIEASEVPWASGPPLDRQSGFVDLVLDNAIGKVRVIIECKRWLQEQVFVAVKETQQLAGRLSAVWAQSVPETLHLTAYLNGPRPVWKTVTFGPPSPIASVCLEREGQGQGRLLEADVRQLLEATEALALDEARALSDHDDGMPNPSFWHVPMLVTSSPLVLARLDAHSVPLDGSPITEEVVDEKLVNAILFEKPLAWSPGTPAERDSARLAHRTAQRTRSVLIVRAGHLCALLAQIAVQTPPQDESDLHSEY